MKWSHSLVLVIALALSACQPTSFSIVRIIDNEQIITLQTDERVPSAQLHHAAMSLNSHDQVLLNGLPVAPHKPITSYPITLQMRRAVLLAIIRPDGEQKLQSSAFTIRESLQEAHSWLYAVYKINPLPNSPTLAPGARAGVTIYQLPSHELTLTSNGTAITSICADQTVGDALAQAGIPLMGLDYSLPVENEPISADGQIRVVRVTDQATALPLRLHSPNGSFRSARD